MTLCVSIMKYIEYGKIEQTTPLYCKNLISAMTWTCAFKGGYLKYHLAYMWFDRVFV